MLLFMFSCKEQSFIENDVVDPYISTTANIKLEDLKMRIEKLSVKHHVEILKIMKNYNEIKLNENKFGIFINLSFLDKEVIHKLINYVSYIEEQEKSIMSVETQINNYRNDFFISSG